MSGYRRLICRLRLSLQRVFVSLGVVLVPTASLQAEEVRAAGPTGVLKGTLVRARDQKAGVLILPGSGPVDRDGNFANGTGSNTYRFLAEALASDGISSLRIDKRGMFASAGATANPNDVTLAKYADDAAAWISVMKRETGLPFVWLLGHSEGGLVALAAAGRQDLKTDLCGLLLAAVPGRPVGRLLREQLARNPSNAALLPEAERVIEKLENGLRVPAGDMPVELAGLFAPDLQGYLIDLLSHDPAALLEATSHPVLILHGTQDLQVTEEDARRLALARPDADLHLFTDVTHMLKTPYSSDLQANLATYTDKNLPVSQEVVSVLSDFIAGHLVGR